MDMHSIAWWPTCAVLSVATFMDLRSRRIPNWLVLPFLVVGIVVSGGLHGWHGIAQSLGGVGVGTVVFGCLALMGGMGMGDVKLCAAIGAWVGPWQLVIALVVTGLSGGVMAICWAVYGGFLSDLVKGSGELVFGWKQRGMRAHPDLVLSSPRARKMPYAPAIAIGTLFSFFAH
jgi:prepilin peptidase CpaA